MTRIAILGLGAMGARMAARLLDAQLPLTVYNRSPERCAPLAERGARVASSPREAAADAELVISMVTDDAASRALWTDPERGALLGLRPDAIAIESSTASPAWIAELARHVHETGATLLDAPVAGSRPQAEAGQLIYMVGGDAAAFARVEPILGHMGKAVRHVGATGAGASLKLAVNAMFAIELAAFTQCVDMLARSGFERPRALELLAAMPITSPAVAGVSKLIAAERYAPLFPIDLVEKDLRYAAAHATAQGSAATMAAAAWAVYAEARARGLGAENIHAIAKLNQ